MRLFRPCFVAGYFYPEAFFRIETNEKLLFLSFDDGPDPETTPVLIEILKKYGIKAMFFCDGRAAEKYPELIEQIKSECHLLGNHGYNHLNGWTTSAKRYINDINQAAEFTSSALFRPPYGRIGFRQYRKLKRKFKIIFWDIMPYDFDMSFGPEKVLKVLQKKVRSGSIIVFHDQSRSMVLKLLPEFIDSSMAKGFRFALPDLLK